MTRVWHYSNDIITILILALISVLQGMYNDPNHPGCLRKITVKNGVVTIVGSDNIDGSKQWSLKAKVVSPTLCLDKFIDFTS